MSVKTTDLAKELLAWAPGCPGPVVRRELVRAAQRFCRATYTLVVDVAAVPLAPGVGEVDLGDYTDPYLLPIKAIRVKVDGRAVPPASENALAAQEGNAITPKARPSVCFYMQGETTLRVYPYSTLAQVLSVQIAQMPTDKAPTLPDALAVEWRDAIVGGALQRICSIPDQPYTSADYASMGAGWYAAGVHRAKLETNRSRGAAPNVKMRPFA